jgi:NAD-reducing hydrogenase small subunit
MKEFPPDVDVTLVEGAVSSEEDLEKIQRIRGRTKILISLGDCAVTGNVPSMRNLFGVQPILERAYLENVTVNPQIPTRVIPKLLARVVPVHEVVKVDVFVPGCPPPAKVIGYVLTELLAGRQPDANAMSRFGA